MNERHTAAVGGTEESMKRFLCLILAGVLLLALAGCKSNPPKVQPNGTDGTGETTPSQSTPEPIGTALKLGDADGTYGTLFGHGEVISVSIEISDGTKLSDVTDGTYLMADVTVNGTELNGVGVGVDQKDPSTAIIKRSGADKFSYRVDIDAFADGTTAEGLDEFTLSNFFGDPSCMRAYLYGLALRELGGESPYMAYAALTVNGEPAGLYLMTEAVSDSYMRRTAGSDAKIIDDLSLDELYAHLAESAADGQEIALFEVLGESIDMAALARCFAIDVYAGNFMSYFDLTPHGYALIGADGGKQTYTELFTGLSMGAYQADGGRSVTASIYEPNFLSGKDGCALFTALMDDNDFCTEYQNNLEKLYRFFGDGQDIVTALDGAIGGAVKENGIPYYTYEAYQAQVVFSGVELSELLGDPGNVLVPAEGEGAPDTGKEAPKEYEIKTEPTVSDYETVKGLVDYLHQRATHISGQLSLD